MGNIRKRIIVMTLLLGMIISLTSCKKNKVLDVEVGMYTNKNGATIEILEDHKIVITGYDFEPLQNDLEDWLITKADLSEEEASDLRKTMNFNENLLDKELSFELYTEMYEDTGSLSIWLFKLLENDRMTTYFSLMYYPANKEIVLDSALMTLGQVTTTSEVFCLRES